MANYNTSFVVNAADLAKILEQIKIAERHAAGENLVDIIGQDSALLPVGLRTVDGSYNHLLPGQSQVGAADELFPRLLPPVYINEADGDTMPLGPPGSGAPTITNTNYDPTISGSHSVADADPRIISNLIVDQTLTNRSALIAALLVISGGANGGDIVAATAQADAILLARDAAAAAPSAAATATAYAAALGYANTIQIQVGNALASLTALRADAAAEGAVGLSATDAAAAVLSATAALNAAISLRVALQAPNTTVDPAAIASALAQEASLTNFLTAVTIVKDVAIGGIFAPVFNAIVEVQTSAQALSTAAVATVANLTVAAANPPRLAACHPDHRRRPRNLRRRLDPDRESLARHRPVTVQQRLDDVFRPVLRPRPRSRHQGRQRHHLHSPATR